MNTIWPNQALEPFGAPPSLLGSRLVLLIFLCVSDADIFLAWRSVRE
jgi:hypothetical protein